MQEFKKVFNLKIVLLIFVAALINILIFERTQSGEISVSLNDNGESEIELDYKECREKYSEAISCLNLLTVEQIKSYEYVSIIDDKLQTDEYIKKWVMQKLSISLQLRDNYQVYVNNIVKKASQKNEISVFASAGQSDVNRQKTENDYSTATEINWKITDTWVVESVLMHNYTIYVFLILCAIIVWQFNSERKLGLWGMLHQTSGGREKLYFRRVSILLMSSIGVAFVLYFTLLLYSFARYGGIETLMEPMQCVEMWYRLPYDLKVWQIIVIHILSVGAAGFCFASILWLFITIFANIGLSIVCFGITIGIEYVLFTSIGVTSALSLLRHCNLFTLLYPEEWICQYFNVVMMGVALSRYVVVGLFAILAIVLTSILIVIIGGRKYPINTNGRVDKVILLISEFFNHIKSKLPVKLYELRKILVHQKMILLIVLLSIVAGNEKRVSGIRYADTDGNFLKEIYEDISGKITSDTYTYMQRIRDKRDDIESDNKKLDYQYKSGEIDYNSYINYTQLNIDRERVYSKQIEYIDTQLQYLEKLEKERGIKGYLIDERGYILFLGKPNYDSQLTFGLVSLFIIIVVGVLIWGQEKKANMMIIIKTSSGRKRFVIKKIITMIALGTVIWLVVYGSNLINMVKVYKLAYFDAPVQSIRGMYEFPFEISIGVFFACLYFMRLMIIIMFGGIAAFIGYKCSLKKSMIVGLMLLLPHILYILGVRQFEVLSPVIYMSFIQSWNEYGNIWWAWTAYLAIIFSGIYTYTLVVKDN